MFYNGAPKLRAAFAKARYETFIPVKVEEKYDGALKYKESPVMNSLLFARTTERFLKELRQEYPKQFSVYSDPGAKEYTRIADEEMNMFIELNSIDSPNVRYGGEDKPKFHVGDKVRVTEGQFKGFEGHVARVGGEKCLAVGISGIAVMLITHIHPKFLEIINN